MRTIRRIRMFLAILLFGLALVTAGLIDLRMRRAAWRRRGETDASRRRRLARWLNRWTLNYWRFATSLGGLKVEYRVHESCAGAKGPFIAISNHYGAIDGALIAHFLHDYFGRGDYRVVAKAETASWPMVGPVWRLLEAAFVKRDGGVDDLKAVQRMADVVIADDADVIIFPEGLVLNGTNAVAGNRTLLPARPKGFSMIANALPNPVALSCTFLWRDFAPYALSDEGLVPPGSDVVIDVRVVPVDGPPAAVLEREWRRKAEWLRDNA